MTRKFFRGDAPATQQLVSFQITTDDATSTFKITISNKTVLSVGGGGIPTCASRLASAIMAIQGTREEFAELTVLYTAGSDTVELQATTPGVNFVVTSTVTGGTGAMTQTTVATNHGPGEWTDINNWSTGVIPVSGDDVVIDNTSVDIQFGLAQSGVVLNSIEFGPNFSGTIGLPVDNENGYYEYRPSYLQIQATTVIVNCSSSRIKMDLGTGTGSAVTVSSTGQSQDEGFNSCTIKGSATSYTLNLKGGDVGTALQDGDLCTLGTVQTSADTTLTMGSGTTPTTVTSIGGTITAKCSITTLSLFEASTLTAQSVSGASINMTTVIVDDSSQLLYAAPGTITTLTVGSGGTADFSASLDAKTITNIVQIFKGSTLNDPAGTVTFTAGIKLNKCRPEDVTLNLKSDMLMGVA